MLPPPVACGAPSSFETWRRGQPEAICDVIDSSTRASGLVLPTGAGKSLIAVTIASLTGWRTAILTSTRALQDQILRTFESMGVADLRGRSSYPCRALEHGEVFESYRGAWNGCDVGPCMVGLKCPYREKGCAYFDTVAHARTTPILVTNYQAWMSQYGYSDGLGEWDCLILDEAHAAPEEVAQYLAVTLTPRQLSECGLTAPEKPEEMASWIQWATMYGGDVAEQVETLTEAARAGDAESFGPLKKARDVMKMMTRFAIAKPDQWIVTVRPPHDYQFHPLEVSAHVEAALFRNIKKIVLTSATLTKKTAETLGLDPAAMTWRSAPSTFPVERRPVIHVATCRIDHRLDETGTRLWLNRVDQIVGARGDRKGIIHTGSYARAQLIYANSAHRARLLIHDRQSTREQIARFRYAAPGTVLISPSLTTGIDFPGRSCEYQIILKVPWPDGREPVIAARTVKDKAYPAYLAMQDLVQAVGRGMRSETDRCETLILDDHVRWFLYQFRHFAPPWFLDAYKSSLTIPPPPPRL